ncbi:protein TonB [Caulobacter ginsengisoli]|uniref:Protein TonB n=1 Tax=Caulobacter ginsengisoli TaxID=400775 RepID=A0ABU0IL07_9CAUL|nr:TonB family protein [Caulobacter ginsengisoli]MDQ0462701.1 protein TonB [Caulobacter ginsengisoli]
MVVSQSNGFAAPIGSGDYIKRPGLSRMMVIAIGVSVAVHVALVSYLAYQKFSQPMEIPDTDRPLVGIRLPKPLPKPTPVERTKTTPPPTTVKTRATDAPPTDVETSPLPSTDQTATKDDTGSPPVISDGPPTTGTGSDPIVNTPPVIANPTWIKRPGAREFSKYYPEDAIRLGLSGAVNLRCTVAANGSVGGCVVTSETPAGKGFGRAAQKLSRYFVMSPRTVDGKPVDGALVTIPIKFGLE